MRKWHVIFEDDPQNEHIIDEDVSVKALERFKSIKAQKIMALDARLVRGMWITGHESGQARTIDHAGKVPHEVLFQHAMRQAR